MARWSDQDFCHTGSATLRFPFSRAALVIAPADRQPLFFETLQLETRDDRARHAPTTLFALPYRYLSVPNVDDQNIPSAS